MCTGTLVHIELTVELSVQVNTGMNVLFRALHTGAAVRAGEPHHRTASEDRGLSGGGA